MYFIEAQNIVKQYASHLALDNVSIQVPEGKIFGLLGPNGAGKTTLIRIINRITAPDSGQVFFNGHPSEANDVFQIGYLPEERGLYKKMKVSEQAIYLAQLKGLSYQEARKRLIHWFEKFEIMPWWNKKLEELSKGMQQKIQFIITVIHEPPLLIFDEPFSGFDPVNAELLKQEILSLKAAGHTIIFSTHNMASVEELCDSIALIDHAHVVLSGAVDEIKERYRTSDYLLCYPTASGSLQEQPHLYQISSTHQQGSITEVCLHKQEGTSTATLLQTLANQVEIRSFMEKIPSMNEIFIQTVSQHPSI